MGWGVRNRQKASRIRVCEWLSGCGRELDRLEGYLLQLSERSSMLSSWEQAKEGAAHSNPDFRPSG